MKTALLMLTLVGLNWLTPLTGTAQSQSNAAADSALRLPLRGHLDAIGAPQVSEAPGVILIEVPSARLEHSGVMAPPVGSRLSVVVGEIAQGNSRSQKRATVTLRLRPGATLRAAQVQAAVEDGALRISLIAEGPAVAVPAPPPPALVKAAPVAAAPVKAPQISEATQAAPAENLWLRVVIALGLLGAAALLALKLKPRRGAEVRPAAIDIVASRALGRNQRLLVVDVDRQRFLLSASEQGGLRLVAPMKDEGAVARDSAPRAAPVADAVLGDVFEDMLASVTPVRPEAPPAAAAAAPAPTPQGRRANLHLVDGTRGARPAWSPDAPGTFTDEPAEAAPAPGAARSNATQHSTLASENEPPRSSDVAGLVALRRHRQGGRR